ncbi:MAG: TolC family protein [Bergeyella sp.]|nr:TolC family protein [Bergeyella sp.]
MKTITLVLSFWGLLFFEECNAQKVDTAFAKEKIEYKRYLAEVGKSNAAYAAEKFNITISKAFVDASKVFPDPELEMGWNDHGQRRMNMGYGFVTSVNWTLELGGKRRSRIDLAKNEALLSEFLLEDYFRNLRADATLAFLEAIQKRLLLEVQHNSYAQMKKISDSDSIRYHLGDLSEVDAKQSNLEAGVLLNEVFSAEAEFKNSLTQLSLLMGKDMSDTLMYPLGKLENFYRDFSLKDLILEAQNKRADLKAALQSNRVSQSMLKLAKANRALDLGLSLGMEYDAYNRNYIAPTPSRSTINVGVAIPIKFSNNRTGDLRAAQYRLLQSQQEYRQIELVIQSEVVQAYHTYLARQKQVKQFNLGLLRESKVILEGKIYSYKRGESSLLEVLNAQRTHNDVQKDYYDTLYSYAAALVELERTVGIWDIDF